MKRKSLSGHPDPSRASPSRTAAVAESQRDGTAFVASPDEEARRAYFTYLNHGAQPGHDVQHWLDAEAHLLAERARARAHEGK